MVSLFIFAAELRNTEGYVHKMDATFVVTIRFVLFMVQSAPLLVLVYDYTTLSFRFNL